MTKLTDLINQETVTLHNGDILAANTEAVGYLPTRVDTDNLHSGQYLFRVKGIGTADENGAYAEMHVVPLVLSEDRNSLVEDESPIIVQTAGNIRYVTHRNRQPEKDVYGGAITKSFDVAAGEEHRGILNAFVAFTQAEYSLGVNDFNLEGPDYIAGA